MEPKYVEDNLVPPSTNWTISLSNIEPVAKLNEKIYFNIASSQVTGQQLAEAAASLVNFADKDYIQACRLELTPISNEDHWEFRLVVHPVTWFDLHVCARKSPWTLDSTKLKKVVDIGSKFINKSREIAWQQHSNASLIDRKEEPIPVCDYCQFPGSCQRPYEHGRHAKYHCKHDVKRKDATVRQCQWYAFDELIIKEFLSSDDGHTWHFLASARRELIRDVLVAPCPPLHFTNRQMIALPACWTAILNAIATLRDKLGNTAVTCVAFNFGEWETATSRDKYAADCHAHAHLLLSLDAVKQCNATMFAHLKGRYGDPPNYDEQNANILEHERIASLQMKLVVQQMQSVGLYPQEQFPSSAMGASSILHQPQPSYFYPQYPHHASPPWNAYYPPPYQSRLPVMPLYQPYGFQNSPFLYQNYQHSLQNMLPVMASVQGPVFQNPPLNFKSQIKSRFRLKDEIEIPSLHHEKGYDRFDIHLNIRKIVPGHDGEWSVSHTDDELKQLHNQLQNTCSLPQFPPKHNAITRMGKNYQEKRRQEIEAYLKQLYVDVSPYEHAEFNCFLAMESHVDKLLQQAEVEWRT